MIIEECRKLKNVVFRNSILLVYFLTHVSFSTILGRNFLLAPDEGGYLYTFNNLYGNSIDQNPQLSSGWITAPKFFLWMMYAPAKILNIFGVPDYLAIRYLSIALGALTIHFLLKCSPDRRDYRRFSLTNPLLIFFVPSIFLWNSIGLRESFIIAELALFFLGANYFFQDEEKKGIILSFLGSFGLLATKNYLWVCLSIAILLTCIFFRVLKVNGSRALKFIVTTILLPLTLFGATSSIYVLEFIIGGSITAVGERSGESVTTILIDTGKVKNQTGDGSENQTGDGSENQTGDGSENQTGDGSENQTGDDNDKEMVTLFGDSTLISLKTYLDGNPNSRLTKLLELIGAKDEINRVWNKKLREALANGNVKVKEKPSINNDILKPGKLDNPLSVIRAACIFLFGPFPFLGDPSLSIQILSFESPMWWAFFLGVFVQVFRHRHTRFYLEPTIALAAIFLFGEILFSALVEVNLGTSFRHRSIIVVPLVYLCFRIGRLKHQKEIST